LDSSVIGGEKEKLESKALENFMYGMRAHETRRKYVPIVEKFFDFLGFKGAIEQKAEDFMAKASGNNPWVSESLLKFITYQKSRAERGEISEATVRNFFKPVKLFLDPNLHPNIMHCCASVRSSSDSSILVCLKR
jgi:hypothetical protein